jgi:hypothetical protein
MVSLPSFALAWAMNSLRVFADEEFGTTMMVGYRFSALGALRYIG